MSGVSGPGRKETVMTMGDRIKPARGRDTGEIKGAPTVAVHNLEEAGGNLHMTAPRTADRGG